MNKQWLLIVCIILFAGLSCKENDFYHNSTKAFSGFAYVKNMAFTGSVLEFCVYSQSARNTVLHLRCRSFDEKHLDACKLNLNNKSIPVIIPEANTWQTVSLEVDLQKGNNIIRIECNKTLTRDLHIDYLDID